MYHVNGVLARTFFMSKKCKEMLEEFHGKYLKEYEGLCTGRENRINDRKTPLPEYACEPASKR